MAKAQPVSDAQCDLLYNHPASGLPPGAPRMQALGAAHTGWLKALKRDTAARELHLRRHTEAGPPIEHTGRNTKGL